jgi:N-acetylglucosaminyldiphosphoundecaprenol N-acetyl-beta-D-mannosaminyltransferase
MNSDSEKPRSVKILGVNVDLLSMDEVVGTLYRWVEERKNVHLVVATGMHGVMESLRDPKFRDILDSADLLLPDGMSLVWAARLRGLRHLNRVSGPDLMWECLKNSQSNSVRHFFYGDTWDTLGMLNERLQSEFPGLEIAGSHSPPFRQLTPEEDEEEVTLINESGTDMLWVGLGLPKQERWIYEHRDRLQVPVCLGVGAAFKFLSGHVRRAPEWMGNIGLEWSWRLAQEPRRMGRRVLIDGPRFAGHLALELTHLKKYR